jgi:hypothetical protein
MTRSPCTVDSDRDEYLRDDLRECTPKSQYREGRVALLAELAEALIEGQHASREAALFVGRAISSWLEKGGRLEDHLRVRPPKGSKRTPKSLYAKARHGT